MYRRKIEDTKEEYLEMKTRGVCAIEGLSYRTNI
jgi:hypothetical protein